MILIKYATRGRVEWFKKTIQNIVDTIKTKDYVIVITADEDDITMNNKPIRDFVMGVEKCFIYYGISGSKIAAINRDMAEINSSVNTCGWDMLINMSDDMYFNVSGWDEIMLNRIKETWGDSTDYFAHFNDGYAKDALPTMSIMGYDYYKRFDYIYHPLYKSFSCDAEAMFVAMMLGRHKYFADLLFLHQHPANSPKRGDEIYRINSLATPHDTKIYWERLNNYFDVPESQRLCVPFQQYVGKHG